MLTAADRTLTAREKVRQVLDCNATSEAMALAGLRARHPQASERELRLRLAAQRLGRPLMIAAFGWDPERPGMADDALRATLAVTSILDALGLDYLIGGSLASSIHGRARSTQDADVAVDLPAIGSATSSRRLQERFYVDEQMATEAVARSASFNVIHLETMFKVDLFVLGADAMSRAELARGGAIRSAMT
jgi:hypothetical protein